MNIQMAPNIPLALALFAAAAAVALRAATRRPEPRPEHGAESGPTTVTAGGRRPRPAVTTGTHDRAGRDVPRSPGRTGRPAGAVEQTQHVFHELHADGRNALCAVCDGQYGWA